MKNFFKISSLLSLSLFLSAERNANAQTTFNYTGSVQTWTVPCGVSSITIEATGAQGGDGGGAGAQITGTFNVSAGEQLDIMVGGEGFANNEGSGGGGSFVWIDANDTLLVAAGGGGGWYFNAGGGGSATRLPTPGSGPQGSSPGGSGGDGGSGGTCTFIYAAGGGGAGWLTNGGQGSSCGGYGGGYGGNTPISGGAGGAANFTGGCFQTTNGGYGGGGGCTCYAAGGGGGYNGGGGAVGFVSTGNGGGGGGSYNSGSNQTNTGGVNFGYGKVIITQNSVAPFTAATGNVVSNVTCNGANNGIASAIVTNSAPAFTTYSWAPVGGSQDTAYGLSNGTYTVTVTGYCGSATASVTITQPNILTVSGNVVNNVTCNGSNNGSARAIVGGGTMPYTYSWTGGGGTKDTASGLSNGIYKVTIVDFNGCSNSTTVTITQPNLLTADALFGANAACGISNGFATSAITGGTGPYTYSWTGGSTNTSISGLSGGTYMVNVTDSHGCGATSSVNITETPAVFAAASTIANNACNGGNQGTVLSNVAGGMPPFTYAWSGGGGNNFSAAGLTAGTYTVTVTDANGCTSTAASIVTQPTAIMVITDSTVDPGNCTGSAWVIVSGGVTPYTYSWDNGGTTYKVFGECRGTYCCTITDANRCEEIVCIRVRSLTGVENIEAGSGISVFPNPNNGEFTIRSSVDGGSSLVEIYNTLGEKVYTTTLTTTQGGDNTINISSQPNGIYFYRITGENGSLIGDGKIILQK